jgi:Domain of unknown function (DUF5615)
MARPKLHVDADASIKALYAALTVLGHDVTRTPCEWMPLDADDETRLLSATAQGRAIFTFNVRDFVVLARRYPHHGGIVLAAHSSWRLGDLAPALNCLLTETDAANWSRRVEWLNRWR